MAARRWRPLNCVSSCLLDGRQADAAGSTGDDDHLVGKRLELDGHGGLRLRVGANGLEVQADRPPMHRSFHAPLRGCSRPSSSNCRSSGALTSRSLSAPSVSVQLSTVLSLLCRIQHGPVGTRLPSSTSVPKRSQARPPRRRRRTESGLAFVPLACGLWQLAGVPHAQRVAFRSMVQPSRRGSGGNVASHAPCDLTRSRSCACAMQDHLDASMAVTVSAPQIGRAHV